MSSSNNRTLTDSIAEINIKKIYRMPVLGLVATFEIKDSTTVELCVHDQIVLTAKDKKRNITMTITHMELIEK